MMKFSDTGDNSNNQFKSSNMEIITPSSSTLPILNFNKKEEVKLRSKSLGRQKPENKEQASSTIINLLKAELISTKN